MFPVPRDGRAHACVHEATNTHVIPDLATMVGDYLTFSGEVECSLNLEARITSMVRISPTEIAVGTYGRGVLILDCTTMQITHKIDCFAAHEICSIPGYFAYKTGGQVVCIYDVDTHTMEEHHFNEIRSLKASGDAFIVTTEMGGGTMETPYGNV